MARPDFTLPSPLAHRAAVGLASSYEDIPWHDLPSDFQQMYYQLAQEVLDAAALEVDRLKIIPLGGSPVVNSEPYSLDTTWASQMPTQYYKET